ncbi:hypothetical protein J5069_03460 [Candidatus Symbiopectobacterium sp. NZEC127]|uniref:hypothetical protein n=1 Tax=Candidatus Symbiopectobacterium sp. NZEC127 TaxID=2820472 RepID=UPI002225D1EC|nr:hypothetical protein [Candidatus Symbiopectobacterium sp. NZEC127]MCW2484950.1 hypothetical protein [Candidatus Symbiopectobacterium sp. NZEC127]
MSIARTMINSATTIRSASTIPIFPCAVIARLAERLNLLRICYLPNNCRHVHAPRAGYLTTSHGRVTRGIAWR